MTFLSLLRASKLEEIPSFRFYAQSYLAKIATGLEEVDARIADPKKRAKWTSKVTAKFVERLPPASNTMCSAEKEAVNITQVNTAMTLANQGADINMVLTALEVRIFF